MDLKEIGINTRKWVNSAQDRHYWRDLLNTSIKRCSHSWICRRANNKQFGKLQNKHNMIHYFNILEKGMHPDSHSADATNIQRCDSPFGCAEFPPGSHINDGHQSNLCSILQIRSNIGLGIIFKLSNHLPSLTETDIM